MGCCYEGDGGVGLGFSIGGQEGGEERGEDVDVYLYLLSRDL